MAIEAVLPLVYGTHIATVLTVQAVCEEIGFTATLVVLVAIVEVLFTGGNYALTLLAGDVTVVHGGTALAAFATVDRVIDQILADAGTVGQPRGAATGNRGEDAALPGEAAILCAGVVVGTEEGGPADAGS